MSILAALVCSGLAAGVHADEAPLRWAMSLGQLPDQGDKASVAHAVPSGGPIATSWTYLLASADEHAASNRAADAGTLAAQGLSQQAWAGAWMPRVDLSASATRNHQRINETKTDTPARSVTLSASLPLWRAADRAAARAQDSQAEQAHWQARSNRTEVSKELSTAYLSAVEVAEQKRLTLAQLNLLQEQLHINERRLQAGVGTVLDVLETRTRIDQARATAQDLDTRLASQRLTLERLSRLRVALPAGFNEDALTPPEVVPTLAEALSMAGSSNPTLQSAQAQINAANAIDEARNAEFWQPTLDAVASASRARQVPQIEGMDLSQTITDRNFGVQMNWALFTGGVQQGRTREATALLVQAQARHDDAQAQVEATLRDAYQTLAQARQVISVQREVEASASATYDALRKAFVAGMRTNIDLLNAQQQIYVARQSVVSARINALLAQVNILATVDQLDPEHITALMPLFDNAALPAQPEHTL